MKHGKKIYTVMQLEALQLCNLKALCTKRGLDYHEGTEVAELIGMVISSQGVSGDSVKPEQPMPIVEPVVAPVEVPVVASVEVAADVGSKVMTVEKPVIENTIEKTNSGEERIWFKVQAGSQPHEKSEVFASINGESVLIKRNQWVKLKRKFLNVFEDAVNTEIEITPDDNVVERKIPRFNIQTRSIEDGLKPDRCQPA